MVFVLVWIVCGIAAAWIAAGKGRNSGNYGCLGFLLGPLGVLLAFAASADEESLRAKSVQSGAMRVCPSCAETVRREATKCRFCGEVLPPLRTASKPAVGNAIHDARGTPIVDDRFPPDQQPPSITPRRRPP